MSKRREALQRAYRLMMDAGDDWTLYADEVGRSDVPSPHLERLKGKAHASECYALAESFLAQMEGDGDGQEKSP